MGYTVFFLLALLSAAGAYFALPLMAVLVPIGGLLLATIYFGSRAFNIDKDKYSQDNEREKHETQETELQALSLHKFERQQMDGRLAVPKEIGAEVIYKIEQLKDKLPYDAFVDWGFEVMGRLWVCRLMVRSTAGQFYSSGAGKTPVESLDMASAILRRQVREWLMARKLEGSEVLPPQGEPTSPRVLIVDDDVDAALMMESIFRQQGCVTNVATSISEAQRKLSLGEADIVVLDWRLSDSLNADTVMENTVANIRQNSGLRQQFETHPAKVITFSSYDQNEIHLPESPYFRYVDHWKKAMGYGELSQKTSGFLQATGF